MLGSISSRCSGKWARGERAAEIEPKVMCDVMLRVWPVEKKSVVFKTVSYVWASGTIFSTAKGPQW